VQLVDWPTVSVDGVHVTDVTLVSAETMRLVELEEDGA